MGISTSGFFPSACTVKLPGVIFPPQNDAFIYAIFSTNEAFSDGAISTAYVVSLISIMETACSYGKFSPIQLSADKVASTILLLTGIRNTPIRCYPYGRYFFYLNSNKSNKYRLINTSILSSGWVGEESPYTNSITIEGVRENTDICILPSSTWTSDIIEVWGSAGILTGEQSEGSITLKAYGEKPGIDIPISVLIGDTVIVEGGE